ncbi:MAG TPA: hypothetical protein DCM45_04780 [Clostridiales bacterium]|nr:hypothetical protein [Clostridiales bacterium]
MSYRNRLFGVAPASPRHGLGMILGIFLTHRLVSLRPTNRDTRLQPVGFGEPGILNLMTPMMTSMPFCSVMADDLAVLYPGEPCGCGNSAPYFEVLGRVGLADIKTCAAGAAELLNIKVEGDAKRHDD